MESDRTEGLSGAFGCDDDPSLHKGLAFIGPAIRARTAPVADIRVSAIAIRTRHKTHQRVQASPPFV